MSVDSKCKKLVVFSDTTETVEYLSPLLSSYRDRLQHVDRCCRNRRTQSYRWKFRKWSNILYHCHHVGIWAKHSECIS